MYGQNKTKNRAVGTIFKVSKVFKNGQSSREVVQSVIYLIPPASQTPGSICYIIQCQTSSDFFFPPFFLYPCPHPSLSHSRVLSASFLLKSLSFFPSFGDLDQDNFYKEAACYISRVAWDALNSVLRPMLMRGEKAMGD